MRLKNVVFSVTTLAAASLLATSCGQQPSSVSIATVEDNFMSPPDSIRVAAYWYWLNDNLSPEGAVKDLQAMKKAGITRAQIGMIGIDGLPYGDAKYNSDLWWETLHQALKTAGELDIEIGIFNCPGWSQSGGPWVKPQEAMRRIVSAQTIVEGPGKQTIELPAVDGACQDEAVIAYPAFTKEAYAQTFSIKKTEGQPVAQVMQLDKPSTLRSVEVKVGTPINTMAVLKARDGNDWKEIKTFAIDRYNDQNIVGFEPYAPVIVAIPEAEYNELMLEIAPVGAGQIDVTLSEQPKVERTAEKQLAKMCQVPLPMWDFYMWGEQPDYTAADWTIDPAKVVVLTNDVKDGVLTWDVPEGRWVVSRIAMAPTGVTNSPASPEATGLEIDKINKEHLEGHFDAYIGEILRRIPAEDRKTFRIVVEDSYETGGQNWTDGLAEKFTERYGYSPLPYLPVLQGIPVGSNEMSDRFLWDLRRLVADLVAYEYVGGLKEISNKHGLTTWLENYGHWGFPSEFLLYGGQSDEVAGEYWSEGTLGDIENRAASSCGHIYGKPKIWAESCTAAGNPFGRYPYVMKQRVDRFFTEGINASLLHLVIHQLDTPEEPGLAAWFGNEFNRKNTWFEQLDLFTDYLRRCNYVLQQGRYVADAAYFIGEDAPKMTGECNPPLPEGYSFDYINADILKNHAKVKDGRLVLDSGMEYSVLVLPNQDTMRPEMLKCIEKFVKDGLTVVGPAPVRSPSLEGYPQADAAVREIASTMWTDGAKVTELGKGRVFAAGTTMQEVFDAINLRPDLSVPDGEQMPLFIHRTLKDAQIYFIANPTEQAISINPTFRAADGLQPQLWNPANGTVRTLPQFMPAADNGITVPVQLEPLESAFIVFRKDAGQAAGTLNYPAYDTVADLTNSTWDIAFESTRRGPQPISTDSLFDWSQHPDMAVANYSGKAVYTTQFDLAELPQGRTYVDLGKVMVMAKVKVNGQYAGGAWTYPYRVDITPLLQAGKNTLEVEVVSTWRNRLIGDAALPADQRLTKVNFEIVNPGEALQPSGLLGPVRVIAEK